MDQLFPLVVAVPLLAAAAMLAARPLLEKRRLARDLVAVAAALSVAVMLAFLADGTYRGDAVYWFGGFHPMAGVVIGIDFEAGPLSAGLACLGAVLMIASMIFAWKYFPQVGTYFHVLLLTFLAGMTGFCLTGDVFDLFVWFELMGVSAYALTAYRPEERGPIQGALNFAITNSVGAYLSLSGIALIYARTGALNMAQISVYLSRHPPDGLVVIGFLLIITGLLVKGAIVPFHFWLADAHAVAPTPVCVLFSGVMVELGLYAVARLYWSVFGAALGHRAAISHLFLALGVLTAVVGALFCFRERHVKRLLAFSTVSHAGLFLAGFALLTPLGLAGAALAVVGHAFVKAALFLGVGIVLHRLHSVNETWLHGRGRQLRVTGVAFTLAGLGLADLPPFGSFLGQGWIDDGGGPWLAAVCCVCTVLCAGAVLRVAFGVFYGLGDPPSEDRAMAAEADEETGETSSGRARTPLSMLAPCCVLVGLGLAAGLLAMVPAVADGIEAAAVRFQDQAGYAATVLRGVRLAHPVSLFPPTSAGVTPASVLIALCSVLGAVLLALAALYWRRLPVLRRGYEPGTGLTVIIERFQSGVINDYITWLVTGVAALGAVLSLIIRLRAVGLAFRHVHLQLHLRKMRPRKAQLNVPPAQRSLSDIPRREADGISCARWYLAENVTSSCGKWRVRMTVAVSGDHLPTSAVQLLNQLVDSVLVVEPVRDAGGGLTDFFIVEVSPGYIDPGGRPGAGLVGHTLLQAYPDSALQNGLFARAARVLADGVPQFAPGPVGSLTGGTDYAPVADLRAVRYDGCVVFTWRGRARDDGRLAEALDHVRTRVALAAARDLLAHSEQRAAEEHELALRLQRAIMPADVRLVETAGVDIAVRCRPAMIGSLVAGDWYDALQLPDGELLFVVGDIAGHGIEAVTGMVAARNSLRGLAATGAEPHELLTRLNYSANVYTEGVTGTVICGRYNPVTRVLRWARAGHLPPLLIRGDVAEIQSMPEGMLLGVEVNAEYEQVMLQLKTGDTLLFYTDGLIERRAASISDALADFAAAAVPADPDIDTHVARILANAASDTGDDACLLAVRVR